MAGNSPSRSELHGEHMSNIANSSGQETFQSHSYPVKVSGVPLPGIHGENGVAGVTKAPNPTNHNHQDSNFVKQVKNSGPNTPDPMYSMDSLNVFGNNSASITSSELPPSSLSPENRRDTWVPSSFSDESLHAQCQTMSRHHKNFHHNHTDDEGMSSSTYESDSLNPDTILCSISPRKASPVKREVTPKPEIAEEATEQLPVKPSIIKLCENPMPPKPSIVDHSITINGRKVSGCEETPLPIILGSQRESKIGITSTELSSPPTGSNGNFNTIKRGRMKSPPPPPPSVKNCISSSNGTSFSDRSHTLPHPSSVEKKEFQSSFNSLLRRNVYSSNRRSSVEIGDELVCGGEVNVIQTPLTQLTDVSVVSTVYSDHDHSETETVVEMSQTEKECEAKKSAMSELENMVKEAMASSTTVMKAASPSSPESSSRKRNGSSGRTNGIGKFTDILSLNTSQEEKPPGIDDNSDIVIRPCEQRKQTQNFTVPSSQSTISNNGMNQTGPSTGNDSASTMIISPSIECEEGEGGGSEMLLNNFEDALLYESYTYLNNKTELDCEDAQQDDCGSTNISTAAPTASTEIKPVSCAAGGEKHSKKEECKEDNHEDDDKKKVKMTDEISELCVTGDDEDGGEDVSQITQNNINPQSTLTNESSENTEGKTEIINDMIIFSDLKVDDDDALRVSPCSPTKNDTLPETVGGIYSKFGNEDKSRGDVKHAETAPTVKPPSPPLMSDLVSKEKSENNSKSSSRRGSSASSIDLNGAPPTNSNGLLNCNRLSLCSLPDNNELEFEFETAETADMAFNDVAIQDQPMSSNSNDDMIGSCILSENTKNDNGNDLQKAEIDSKVDGENENVEISEQEMEKPVKMDAVDDTGKKSKDSTPDRRVSREESGLVAALRNSLEGLIPMMEPMGKTVPKTCGKAHQRRLSTSKIDLDSSSKPRGDYLASSVPTNTNAIEKYLPVRKGSFPELFIATESQPMKSIKPLNCIEKSCINPEVQPDASIPNNPTSNLFLDPLIGPKFDSSAEAPANPFIFNSKFSNGVDSMENSGPRSKAQSFASNDFLQTLGEIYACKSKLITNKIPGAAMSNQTKSPPRSTTASLPPSPKDKFPPSVIVVATRGGSKTADSSLDGIDILECQDRSISEYNISPRSARELISESLLNCSSLSSSLSQKSIGTIHEEVDEKLVPFSAGIETKDTPSSIIGPVSTADINETCNDTVDSHLIKDTPSTTTTINSGTFKKKPTFLRGKAPKGLSLPCIDTFESPILLSTNKVENDVKTENDVSNLKAKDNFPPPPPMPPLQYCTNTSASDSSASSSIGDSSEVYEKSKNSPPICGRLRKHSSESRHSPDKSLPKSNGSMSSECSLVELSVSNPKSTSDAIIIELKKAQAKKLRAMGQKPSDSMTLDFQKKSKNSDENVTATPLISLGTPGKSRNGLENSFPIIESPKTQSNLLSTASTQCSADVAKEVEDPLVKTIVNGRHTNSIIVRSDVVNSSAVVSNSDTFKVSRIGTHQTNKFSAARARGNIMSPSLSGNYTEMNGIDSETMGASSIHDDELSGQLQQKENHINELHGNVEEVQTSNKLDGASFRRVLNEYEKTLSMFIQQIDQLKQRMEEAETEKQTLIKERDQALEDLRNVESAFSDVHRKYERAKALLENMKTNEDTLIRRDQEMMQRIQNRDKKIDMIKEKAQESIEKMHLDYETRIKEMEFENAKLRAQYRKMEMKLSTLENDVEQKAKENAQLSALCDELINGQVGQV